MAKSYCLHQSPPAIAEMLLLLISAFCLLMADASIGVCYGTLGDNLPSAPQVIALCNKYNINRLRLYNPNQAILKALKGNLSISVIVGVPNEELPGIARNPSTAKSWVRNNILNYANVNFRYIAVGNEISPSSNLAPYVVPSMENIHSAISAARLGYRIKVSTSLSMEILARSYPPSTSVFKSEILSSFIIPIVNFLVKNQSPLLLSVYPYFAFSSNTKDISLAYALFTSPSTVVKDGNYEYQNLFDAMVDATHAALEKTGGTNVEIVVSESGWPSAGGTATTLENARIYNSNLIKHVEKGTPRRPGKPVETYVFDLIDENQKSPELEKHWGLFLPNQQPKYPMTFDKNTMNDSIIS
ncbi:unnamed protein product [Fraxinus pennsylvanica]|uniref:Beta-1,3-glucanase n=1 Tax=Fraxinus pennsylvanica TaxID=56036 RepID=A0AAD2E8J0_9LAMI|nr:unnamed protein product [Fraxinus pennsylvanica]